MNKVYFLLIFSFLSLSCVNVAKNETINHEFVGVKIEPVFKNDASIRALKVTPDHIFFAADSGKFGYLNTADHSLAYLGKIQKNQLYPEFRSLASTEEADFVLSVANPALLYKVNYFGKRKLVYEEKCEKVFYDSMAFWNKDEGIAIGDPTNGCLSIIITRDGGEHWKKISCDILPEAIDGEAAFAASNSNIAIVGDNVWVISGGSVSRVYFSKDKGKTWKVQESPLVAGKPSTGGYSIDFYDEKTGIIYGGDYTAPENNSKNKAITLNGGKTWELLAENEYPGYKSCVKFVPNSGGDEIVAVGFTGISYSNDKGNTWKKLNNASFYTIHFINEFTAYAAGKGGISKLTFIENGLAN